MVERVCPWWLGFMLISPLRRWLTESPASLLSPYIREGCTVVEPGPGMGFFTLPMARMVGNRGRVIAVDVQPKMLAALRRRARRARLDERIETRLAQLESLGIDDLAGTADLVLAFAVVHEMPSAEAFFQQAAATLKPGGWLLLAEPKGHIKPQNWESELHAAQRAGLVDAGRPKVRRSLAALFRKL